MQAAISLNSPATLAVCKNGLSTSRSLFLCSPARCQLIYPLLAVNIWEDQLISQTVPSKQQKETDPGASKAVV